MKADIQSVSPSRSVLSVTAEPADVAKVRAAVVKEFAAQATLPGFRKGKAPLAAVERAHAARIGETVLERAIRTAYEKAVEENGLKVFDLVSVDNQKQGDDGSVSFTATVDLVPSFDLPATDGIPVDDKTTSVSDEDVEREIQGARRVFAKNEELKAGDALEADDMAHVDFSATVGDKPLAEAVPDAGAYAERKGAWCTAGSEHFLVPGLPKELLGKKVGESGLYEVEFPADFYKESLRGVKAVYAWTVADASRSVPAVLDEAFFKKVGAKDEADLRDRVRKGLEENAAANDRARHMQQVADFLAKGVSFEVPARALERRAEMLVQQLLETNMQRGVSQEDLSKEREKITAAARARAEADLRIDFVLDAVGDKLGVQLSNDEFAGYVSNVAARRRLNREQVKKLASDRVAMRNHFLHARREKVLSELLKTAKPTASVPAE